MKISNFDYGIKFTWMSYGSQAPPISNTVAKNTIFNNTYGIVFRDVSENNIISDNLLANNTYGLIIGSEYYSSLIYSSNNVLRNNHFDNNKYSFADYNYRANDIDTSNTVNGKPVYYWVDQHDKTVPADAGCVVLKNCSGITVQNLNFANNGHGLLLWYTSDSTIVDNVLTNNLDGIVLKESSNNRIFGNRVFGNTEYGIRVDSNSQGNIISDNIIESNAADGVSVAYSTSNTISRNHVTNNQANGVSLSVAQDNDIVGNNVTLNKVCGVQLLYDASNTNVSGNYLSKNGLGILVETVGNIITENTIIENDGWGMRLNGSQRDNVIHHNNFINNAVKDGLQVSIPATWIFGSYSSGEGPILTAGNPNMWDDGKEANYWSDYTERYPNASQIGNTMVGDTPFFVNENNIDRYPLMVPLEISLPPYEKPSIEPPATQPEPESFPTILVIASATSAATVTACLLVYFKKSKH